MNGRPLKSLLLHRQIGAAAAIALGVVAAGCSSSSAVSKGEVEEKVREGLTAEVGVEPTSVTCDDDLPAEVGSTIRCVLQAENGDRIGLTVTATSVDGDDVAFDILVDEALTE